MSTTHSTFLSTLRLKLPIYRHPICRQGLVSTLWLASSSERRLKKGFSRRSCPLSKQAFQVAWMWYSTSVPRMSPLSHRLKEVEKDPITKVVLKAPSHARGEAPAEAEAGPPPEESEVYIELQKKYKSLLAKQSTDSPAHQELMEQLSQSRIGATRLKEENGRLRAKLSSAAEAEAAKIQELEAQLEDAITNSAAQKKAEQELESLRKGIEAKENQVQKVATKLADNEKRLSKALVLPWW